MRRQPSSHATQLTRGRFAARAPQREHRCNGESEQIFQNFPRTVLVDGAIGAVGELTIANFGRGESWGRNKPDTPASPSEA